MPRIARSAALATGVVACAALLPPAWTGEYGEGLVQDLAAQATSAAAINLPAKSLDAFVTPDRRLGCRFSTPHTLRCMTARGALVRWDYYDEPSQMHVSRSHWPAYAKGTQTRAGDYVYLPGRGNASGSLPWFWCQVRQDHVKCGAYEDTGGFRFWSSGRMRPTG